MGYVQYVWVFLLCVSGLIFLFGACVGSFLDVVRIRSSWKRSIAGRSRCGSCKKDLRWYEMLPIVSYVVLWGRCYACRTSIPVYHLIAEVLMGLLFVLAFWSLLLTGSAYIALVIAISAVFLVPIVLQDIETMEIPEHLSLVFAYVAFVIGFLTGGVGAVVGGVLFAAPFFLLWFCSSGRAIGLGDAKIAVSLGFLLPSLLGVVSSFMFSFWIGVIVVLLCVVYRFFRTGSIRLCRGVRVPFVPFMAIAYFLVLFTGWSFVDVFRLFS